MSYARAFHNSVVLPDGKVLVLGGQTYAVPFSDEDSVYNAELWDPATERFTPLAAAAIPGTTTASPCCCPTAGSSPAAAGCAAACTTNHADGQIFTPPYLLNPDGTPRPRPAITGAPATAAAGSTVTVTHRPRGRALLPDAARRGDPHGEQRPAADPAGRNRGHRDQLHRHDPGRPGGRPARVLHAVRPRLGRRAQRGQDRSASVESAGGRRCADGPGGAHCCRRRAAILRRSRHVDTFRRSRRGTERASATALETLR